MRLTPERVRALLAAATPGPWTSERAVYSTDHLVTMDRRSEAYVTREPDAALIAAAPDLAADLLDAHAALATERERAEAAERGLATLRRALESEGCDCPCCHGGDDHDEECSRCLGCRIEHAVKAALAGCP